MKKALSLLLLTGILLSLLGICGCAGRRAPKLESIYDRVVQLIEASYELNEIFYGEGLPYYDRNLPVYESIYNDYMTEQYTRDYNIVNRDAKYTSVEEIKLAAEQVYTKSLLEDTVYPGVFDGLITTDLGSTSHVASARYLQGNDDLYILIEKETDPAAPVPLVYDYASMKIIKPSNATRVLISIDAWEYTNPSRIIQEQITLAYVDGEWYLDSLTV